MVDHLACAERSRVRAYQCGLSAKNTTSSSFAKCYRELAELYLSIAEIEEDFVRRDMASKQRANDHLIAELSSDRDEIMARQLPSFKGVARPTVRQFKPTLLKTLPGS